VTLAIVRPYVEAHLEALKTMGQIHLTAIHPESGKVVAYDFATDSPAALKWIEAENTNGFGIYWTVNAVRNGHHAKPNKADIVRPRFLHIDIDPPKAGGGLDKTATIERLQSDLNPPSIINDSGNGVQAFWALSEPTLDHSQIEAANRALALKFDGDACHNIDRLMRFPGTVNWPNQKKQLAGRVPVLASIIQPNTGRFCNSEQVAALAASAPPATASRNPIELGDWQPQTCETLYIDKASELGHAIEAPLGNNRSGDTFRVAVLASEQDFSPDEIVGLLLNPNNAVSAHCLDQNEPSRAAARAIEAAQAQLTPLGLAAGRVMRGIASQADYDLIFPPNPVLPAGVIRPRPPSPFIFLDDTGVANPPDWLIKDILPRKGVGLLAGQSGAGKSFVAVNMAVALASNAPGGFFGRRIKQPAGVLYLAAEGGGGLHNRFIAARQQFGIKEAIPVAYSMSLADLSNPSHRAEIITAAQAASARFVDQFDTPLRVIIIDTFSAGFSLDDENANAQVAKCVSAMTDIAEATGAFVLAVHHFGKNQESGPRGGSAFRANVDTVIAVTANRNELTGQTDNRQLAITKQRDGIEGPISCFDLEYVTLGLEPDGEAFGSCIVIPNDRAIIKRVKPQGRGKIAFIKAFADAGGCDDCPLVEIAKVKEQFEIAYEPDEVKREKDHVRQAWTRIKKEPPNGFTITNDTHVERKA
jgi:Mrp family chromosome partitioning ATPase